MPFLTIAGTTYDVLTDGAQGEVEVVGEQERMYDGTLRSAARLEKEVFTFSLAPMDRTSFANLRNAVSYGENVTVGGDATPFGSSITAIVQVESWDYIYNTAADYRIIPHIKITQV